MIVVPESFRQMPRWRKDGEGRAWIEELPSRVDERIERWGLEVDGSAMHGSNALAVPVRRGGEALVLRMTPPFDDVRSEATALAHWSDSEVVRLVDAAPELGASLLERLDHTRSLTRIPVLDATRILGHLAKRLAIPAPASAPSTRSRAAEEEAHFAETWEHLGRPVPRDVLHRVLDAAHVLAASETSSTCVDGDLHFEQVLAGRRHPWIVIDPVMLQGDREYDLRRVLWSRIHELPSDADVLLAFDTFVEAAEVPTERARDWVLVRSASYLLWGLRNGLTVDPPKCVRLLQLFS